MAPPTARARCSTQLPPRPGILDIVHAPKNGGKGSAIRIGFARARGTVFAIQDADLELDPAQLAVLVAADPGRSDARRLRVALPRGTPGRAVADDRRQSRAHRRDQPALRRRASPTWRPATRSWPPTSRAVSTLEANRFDIEPEITAKLLRRGHRILERPVRFEPRSRAQGKKIGWRDGVHAIQVLVRHRFERQEARGKREK